MLDPRAHFMNALLKSRQAALVSGADLERLAGESGRDAHGVLRHTEIGAWLEGERWRTAAERDQCLWRYLAETAEAVLAQAFFPPQAQRFGRVYLLKYDVANVKAVVQGLALERAPAVRPIGAIHAAGRLEALTEARDADAVAAVLRTCGLHAFGEAVHGFKHGGGTRARLALESRLEAEYHGALRHAARSLDGGAVLAWACGVLIDLANLAILCRLLIAGVGTAGSESFIPGGRLLSRQELQDGLSHGLSELPRRLSHAFHRAVAADVLEAYERAGVIGVTDQVIERERLASLRHLLAPQLAPAAVMMWFLVNKEIELRNVRLGLVAVEDGLGFEPVKRQLLW
ncbi:MAG: V-type ATPase subunit [Gammaproteobacteria bacterium]